MAGFRLETSYSIQSVRDNGDAVIDHFADRLLEACEQKGTPICVGIDPVYERLPLALRGQGSDGVVDRIDVIRRFVEAVLDAVAPHVPCVKFQSACFERYHWHGVEAYHGLVHRARCLGLVVIGDVKRGDIGHTAAHYAAACLEDASLPKGTAAPDAITINAWCGTDGIEPFLEAAAASGKGLFAWVRASNPSSDRLQGLSVADGGSVADALAHLVSELANDRRYVGRYGYSLLGAVVGATKVSEAGRLRQLMPQQVFLVPGFGAQGGDADDIRACFNPDGRGAIVAASRSILYAYDLGDDDWVLSIERAAIDMKQRLAGIADA